MIRLVTLTRVAEQDIRDIASYIALDNPPAARQFGAAILDATRQLREFPNSGRSIPGYPMRALRVSSQFRRYHIYYRFIEADAIEIVRVLHSARDISAVLEHDQPEV
jgi:toxin ParE1/3/4